MAVTNAIKGKRLVDCVLRDATGHVTGISDFAVADQEWDRNTDLTKAPTYVKERAAARDKTTRPPAEMDGVGEFDLTGANARGKHWDAELKELKYKEAAGELVLASEVKREWADLLSQVRTKLLGLPTQVKQAIPALSVADLLVFEGLIREALEDLVAAEQEQ